MREVVGATIGSLGAVLGGCCYGCCKGGALVSWWDLWVLFRGPQLTTRKGGILQIDLAVANLAHKATPLLVELVRSVSCASTTRFCSRSTDLSREPIAKKGGRNKRCAGTYYIY